MSQATVTVERRTYAHGEPAKEVGGGMPDAVVELVIRHDIRRVTMRVLSRSHGGGSLGAVNRRDGRGGQPIEVGDEVSLPYTPGVSVDELIRRETTRYGWREVVPGQPWWDGIRFVEAVI